MTQKNKFENEIWPKLMSYITQLLTETKFHKADYINAYKCVSEYCIGRVDYPGPLPYCIRDFIRKWLSQVLKDAETLRGDELLKYCQQQWEKYKTRIIQMFGKHICAYLNRHLKRLRDESKIQEDDIDVLLLHVWRNGPFQSLKTHLTEGLLSLIDRYRNGDNLDTTLFVSVLDSYLFLSSDDNAVSEKNRNIYCNDFERHFLQRTRDYYKSLPIFDSGTAFCEVIKKLEQIFTREETFVQRCLHSSTVPKIRAIAREVLMENRREIIESEVFGLIERSQTEVLTSVYNVLKNMAGGLDFLGNLLMKQIRTDGIEAIRNVAEIALKESKSFVDTIVSFVDTIVRVHHKYQTMLFNVFENDGVLQKYLENACYSLVNDNDVTKSDESTNKLLASLVQYCDRILRKNPKNPSEDEITQILDDIALVFKYINNKDMFQAFYRRMLAKRLILNTSASEDLERTAISKLFQVHDNAYLWNLRKMMADMEESKNLQENFESWRQSQKLNGDVSNVVFSVKVLTYSAWPLQVPDTNFTPPNELEVIERAFVSFYRTVREGRRLTWLHHLFKVELKATYTTRNYIFECSAYEAGVLMLFNDRDKVTRGEIQLATQLNDTFCEEILCSLVKSKILIAEPNNKTKEQQFTLNCEFRGKKKKVILGSLYRKKQEKENEETRHSVEEDRKLQIQVSMTKTSRLLVHILDTKFGAHLLKIIYIRQLLREL
jgi:cullin 1